VLGFLILSLFQLPVVFQAPAPQGLFFDREKKGSDLFSLPGSQWPSNQGTKINLTPFLSTFSCIISVMKILACSCVIALLVTSLTACGQKGPLTRPDASTPSPPAVQGAD